MIDARIPDPMLPGGFSIASAHPAAQRMSVPRQTRLSAACWPGVATIAWLFTYSPAAAVDLGSIDEFDLRLDTTVRTSLAVRVLPQDARLLGNANADDGDRAFRPGPVSERVDFTSQADVSRGELGFNLGIDGWYDAAYHAEDADRSSATFNPVSVPVGSVPADVRRLMGGTVELSQAYVRDHFEVADIPVTVRVGRQTLLWGESLFFAQNGIAAGQAPVDVVKQLSQPLIQSKEVFLPVTQAAIRIGLPSGVSLEGYDQFEWRRDRTPGVGSYFSTSDVFDVGGQRAFIPDGTTLLRGKDQTPSGKGQFGLALRRSSDTLDLGLYALRYDARSPQLATIDPSGGTYRAVFPIGIELAGISASTYLGDDILAGEVSSRWHMPLVSRGFALVSATGPSEPAPTGGYATGQTLAALISFVRQLPPGRLWRSATFAAEFAASDLLRVESHRESRRPGTSSAATAVETVFTTQYYQVLPGLDLTPQAGLNIGLSGRSSVAAGMQVGAGTFTASLSGTYRTVWTGGISLSHFIGPPRQQDLADRDFVMVSLSRTF
jgi:hypothetical protein